MASIRRSLTLFTITTASLGGTWFALTKDSKFVPLSSSDPIFASTFFRTNNPNQNPTTHDLCVKRVPLSKIRPDILEREKRGEGALVTEFCRGLWSGSGYLLQRKYLERKYRSPNTSLQLWDSQALRTSTYPVGTEITDHFEVVQHTPTSIIVRCGGSPSNKDVREGDGLFEMSAQVDWDKKEAVFGLKSCFFQGLGKADSKPMPWHIEFAHRLYTKLWMETAERFCELR